MKTAAIYARYSTDLQSDRSIEDQVSLCRAYAEREGLTVVAVYDDRARSGGSMFGRDGVAGLLRDAVTRRFDVVIVEALDRLSRDMQDLAGVYKRLTFAEVQIRAVHEGEVNTVLVGLRGLVGQMFREDLKHKVRRGMAGRVRDGLSGGGLAYGYAAVPGKPGERAIVPEHADVVRRIFKAFAAGDCPRTIAKALNADNIAPPRGRAWRGSTIHGGPKRACGMLRNELYIGRLIWGRLRNIVDPDTGRRITRNAPTEGRAEATTPALAIVTPELWRAVQTRIDDIARTPPETHRKKRHLLGGLLRCAACGSGMSTFGTDKSGRSRIRCSRHRESGDCPAPHTYYLDVVESTVLAGLKRELMSPVAIAEFLRAYREARQRLAAGSGAARRRAETRLATIARELDRVTDFLVRGVGEEARLDARAKELAAEERTLRREIAAMPAKAETITLHPALIDRYRAQVERLEAGLADRIANAQCPAAAAIRDLINTVTISRDAATGRPILEICGSLAASLEQTGNIVCGSLVPAEGCGQPAYRELRIPFTLRECA